MYATLSNLDAKTNGTDTDAAGTGLGVKRFYLSVDHDFDTIWSAHLTTDFNYESNDGETQLFVKKAYVEGSFSDLATLRIGAASTPWAPFAEDWNGYRFVEKTLVDRTDFGTSADWGLHLYGGTGVLNYQVSALNGGGYKNPTRASHMDFEARVDVQPLDGLVFAVGSYRGDLGKDTASSPTLHTASRYDALAAWHRDGLRLALEWFTADNWNNLATTVTDSADGWSVAGSYDFSRVSIFARYDAVNPSNELDPSLENTYWNTGIAFPITSGVKLAFVYKHELLRNTSNIDNETSEIGVWAEVKW